MLKGDFGMDFQEGIEEIGHKMIIDFVRCGHLHYFVRKTQEHLLHFIILCEDGGCIVIEQFTGISKDCLPSQPLEEFLTQRLLKF